jgi:hypothetical protein
MLFNQLSYNWKIHRILRRLSKQRVELVLQPGNVWVIGEAVPDNEENDALLMTCHMRGWVEPLKDSVPKGRLNPDGTFLNGQLFQSQGPLWKLTDSGWSAINRSHQLTILGLFLAMLGVFFGL